MIARLSASREAADRICNCASAGNRPLTCNRRVGQGDEGVELVAPSPAG